MSEMTTARGSHFAPAKRKAQGKKRSLALLVAIAALAMSLVGGTLAWLVATSSSVSNTFEPGAVDAQIVGANGGVTVANTGNVPAYIRVAAVVNWKSADGKTYPSKPGAEDYVLTPAADWVLAGDGYFYYTKPVAAGSATSEMVGSYAKTRETVELNGVRYTLKVDMLAEAIQAEGVTSGGVPAVTDAWGVSIAGGVVTPVTGE